MHILAVVIFIAALTGGFAFLRLPCTTSGTTACRGWRLACAVALLLLAAAAALYLGATALFRDAAV